jgi:hypothetical protein
MGPFGRLRAFLTSPDEVSLVGHEGLEPPTHLHLSKALAPSASAIGLGWSQTNEESSGRPEIDCVDSRMG